MPDYVYALHEFTPENPDEISLKVGERIEVVEKDDEYGDGWWQGRNSSGKVGLFPQSYTSAKPPAAPPAVVVSNSTNASSSSSATDSTAHIPGALPTATQAVPATAANGSQTNDARASHDGEVMQATMTDVQQAIEQLGHRGGDDASRSFSFASSHSQSTDHSEAEDEEDGGDEHSFGWSRGARKKLAMRAAQENAEREAREKEVAGQSANRLSSGPPTPMRLVAPPIDVEVSDESEDEDEDEDEEHIRERSPRSVGTVVSQIPEEDEEQGSTARMSPPYTPMHSRSASAAMDFRRSPPPMIMVTEQAQSLRARPSRDSTAHIIPSEDFIVPSPGADETDILTARAERGTFPQAQLATPPGHESPPPSPPVMNIVEPSPVKEDDILTARGFARFEKAASVPPSSSSPSAFATPSGSVSALGTTVLPSVAPSASAVDVAEAAQLPFAVSVHSGLPSPSASSFAGSMNTGMQQTLTPPMSAVGKPGGAEARGLSVGTTESGKGKPDGHPSEWTVDQVVEWLRWKGFDEGVCEKFTEQEITGDVLLELDANVLKTEIGIVAFGKRARIVNAIAELRRPPSVFESPSHTPAPVMTPRSQTAQSLPYSHSHSASMQSSAHTHGSSAWAYSPMYAPSAQVPLSPGLSAVGGDSTAKHGWPSSESEPQESEKEKEGPAMGLGLGLQPALPINGKDTKSRPAQLVLALSPSDGAIATTAVGSSASPTVDEDRGAMSESESTLPEAKHKRRLFWRSETGSVKEKTSLHETASRTSKDVAVPHTPPSASTVPSTPASTLTSPTDSKSEPTDEAAPSIPTRRTSKKRESVDGRKSSDRLSLFGSGFSGTLGKSGKSRKPPPKLATTTEKSEDEKHTHHGTFSRIRERRASSRPSTADGAAKEKKAPPPSIKEVKEPKEKAEKTAEKPKEKAEKEKTKEKDTAVLRKRTVSTAEVPKIDVAAMASAAGAPKLKPGQSILEQIGTPDYEGWMRKKGDRYNAWKTRYFVLKGPHLYCLRNKSKSESKIKGYINIVGYRVVADETIDPGRYGFRIVHDTDKTHYFSSEEKPVVREWMKALMKATITRDYSDIVVSSCNIPTIPLTVAQAMNPAPRPPSPGARAATQRAMRPDNPHQLTQRDAQVLLMGVQAKDKGALSVERARLDSFFTNDTVSITGTEPGSPKLPVAAKVPPRPSRELRRLSSQPESQSAVDADLMEWANAHLPTSLQMLDPTGPIFGGLALLRLAEDIKGKPASPRVPDSAFPSGPDDDKLDGLFKLFDFLLDNDVKMGTVSINDIRQGRKDRIVQLLRALRAWEDKRKAIAQSLGPGATPVGAYMAMAGPISYGPKA